MYICMFTVFILYSQVKAPDPQAVEAERLARKPLSPLKPSVVEQSETNDIDVEEEARKKEQRQQCLEEFWENIGYLVESTETGSMLRDMAQMGIEPPKALVPDKTDDKVSFRSKLTEVCTYVRTYVRTRYARKVNIMFVCMYVRTHT